MAFLTDLKTEPVFSAEFFFFFFFFDGGGDGGGEARRLESSPVFRVKSIPPASIGDL